MKKLILVLSFLVMPVAFASTYNCTGEGKTLIVQKLAKASAKIILAEENTLTDLNGLWTTEDDSFYESTNFRLVDFMGNKAEFVLSRKVMMGRAGPIGKGPWTGKLDYLGEATFLKCQDVGEIH